MPYVKMTRRDFNAALLSAGAVASIAQANALVAMVPKPKPDQYQRAYAFWQTAGGEQSLTMFAGDIPAEAEVFKVGDRTILRIPMSEAEFTKQTPNPNPTPPSTKSQVK